MQTHPTDQTDHATQDRIEKARRRNRPRSRNAKLRILADKSRHAEKKRARHSGNWETYERGADRVR